MKETRGNLYINTEDFKEKVVPKLNKYNTKKEQAEEELRAIEKEWLSQYNLQDYNLKLVEAYDRGKKTGSFFEYSLEGNGKSVKLKGLIDYSTNKNTEKTFGGIRVKFYEDHMY
ncbi:hypothetical protein, partial [Methanosarcina mazei]|uniref:hypothetical protein n=1 Tax=Methanosarcina mazei TaxID=2209 RepID=UPI0019101DD7